VGSSDSSTTVFFVRVARVVLTGSMAGGATATFLGLPRVLTGAGFSGSVSGWGWISSAVFLGRPLVALAAFTAAGGASLGAAAPNSSLSESSTSSDLVFRFAEVLAVPRVALALAAAVTTLVVLVAGSVFAAARALVMRFGGDWSILAGLAVWLLLCSPEFCDSAS